MTFVSKWFTFSNDRQYQKAIKAFDRGEFELACELFAECMEKASDNAVLRLAKFYLCESLTGLAEKAAAGGSHSQAAAYYSKASEMHPEYADLHFQVALSQRRCGKPAEALSAVGRAIGINPQFARAIVLQGLLWLESGRKEDGMRRIADGANACSTSEMDTLKACLADGSASDIASAAEAVCTGGMDDAAAYLRLGDEAFKEGRFADAVREYRAAADAAPTYADVQCRLGQALLETGKAEEAETHLRLALELNPDFVDAKYHLARALLLIGKGDSAQDLLASVLSTNPSRAVGEQYSSEAA